ncbi:MAG TPA: hypothetical protein VD758_15215 [Gemmatimonadaceae bacterium]|nr:hypothetical protein [Gemmatimonadaceae bacterium]
MLKKSIAVAAAVMLLSFGTASRSSAQSSAGQAKAGDAIDVLWNGTWYAGTVLETRANGYKIHYNGWASTWDEVVGPDRIRASATAKSQAPQTAPSAAARAQAGRATSGTVAPGKCSCYYYLKGTGLVNGGAFTIGNAGRYSDRDGRPGTTTFDAAEQILTFHGAAYDGQRARYENVKAPTIHIMGPSGRNVLDCDRG